MSSTDSPRTAAEREYEERLRISEYLGHLVSDRDLEEMDPYRCAADAEEVGSL